MIYMPSTLHSSLRISFRCINSRSLFHKSLHCHTMYASSNVTSAAVRAGACGLAASCRAPGACPRPGPRDRLMWLGAGLVCRHFRSLSIGGGGGAGGLGLGRLVEVGAKDSRTFCKEPYSDVSLEEGQVAAADSVAVSEQKSPGDITLKLLSGSFYLPHPDKVATGGEDAHFICTEEQAIGVADGVGGWADQGIDAGEYARQLMSNSVAAIREQVKGFIDTATVLEKAHSKTKEKGSSTACIIALTDQGLHAANIGDSGFIVVRNGSTIFRSPVQQHEFNMPYQLDCSGYGDLPSAAQVFTIPVEPGDVIVVGTDGLFDNLYTNEIAAIVVNATRSKLEPQIAAQKIVQLAHQRAMDNMRQTPFSTAAQQSGYRHYGGKLDDVSVVVSYVTAASSA
ncbi:putative protein phosphatase 2C 55 [Iris pallida]|uniref:Protein phosphatase n=1 Tax=Iris pallida TaxID=29817 RepID=A0AAX6I0R8_IRIPA|nr:putative protein phosphatase 2C 55 [Iris pallida]